jgi:hypothetical protein
MIFIRKIDHEYEGLILQASDILINHIARYYEEIVNDQC